MYIYEILEAFPSKIGEIFFNYCYYLYYFTIGISQYI